MSRLKKVAGVIGVVALAAVVAGGIGAGVAIALVSQFANGQTESDGFERLTVDSEVFGESRTLRVHLPVGYREDSDTRYPLLVVLDGGLQDGHTNRTSDVLSRVGVGGPMIVVGVPAGDVGRSADFIPPGEAYGSRRGRADEFLAFLESEALPAIERVYPTDDTRALAGYSLGGLFVTYSLIERPELFGARFAFSPSWQVGEQAIIAELEAFLAGQATFESFFYVSLGVLESRGMQDAFEAGTRVLEREAPPGLTWKADLTPGADHGSNPVFSTPWALEALWEYRNRGSR